MKGYNPEFIGEGYRVDLPDYSAYVNHLAKNSTTGEELLDYIYYSVIQHARRRVPVLTASNIMRPMLLKAGREGAFRVDTRLLRNEQLHNRDYKKFNSITARVIAKGHLTKREDVQWDEAGNTANAIAAARDTFYYTNAAPQHSKLNNGPWKLLENSIMIKGRVPRPEKVSVFTGPVLSNDDPTARVTLDDDSIFKVPVIFWKVIYYIKEDGKLYHAGFMMGQTNPLIRDQFIPDITQKAFDPEDFGARPFLEFVDDDNFQVPVWVIEDFTRLKFHPAIDPHQDKKPRKVLLNDIQVKKFNPDGSFDFDPDEGVPVAGLSV